MALNLTKAHTFATNDLIEAADHNDNYDALYNAFSGLEAGTSSISKLPLDADPASALHAATKQYVDRYSGYRQPNLVYVSASTVDAESGLGGTSGSVPVLFKDGILRTATTTAMYRFDITRNAVLTSTGGQSGLLAGLTEADNQRYALYAVAFTDTDAGWVLVGDTRAPVQANYSALNTAYGAGKWKYLGYIFNGVGQSGNNDISAFVQAGSMTLFTCSVGGATITTPGVQYATTAGATTLTYTYSAGMTINKIPNTITQCLWQVVFAAVAGNALIKDASGTRIYEQVYPSNQTLAKRVWMPASEGVQLSNGPGSSIAYDIGLAGYIDGALGPGSNPLL